jgi:hypothetical protein
LDPTIRHSFWTVVLGGTIFWLKVNGFGQTIFQKYLALKTVEKARKGELSLNYSISNLHDLNANFYI